MMEHVNIIIEKLSKKKQCFIFGSYIYKYLIHNEKPNDIDVAVPIEKYEDIIDYMRKKFSCVLRKQVLENYKGDKVKMAVIECNKYYFHIQDDLSIKKFLIDGNIEMFRVVYHSDDFYYLNDKGNLQKNGSKDNLLKEMKNKKMSVHDKQNLKQQKHKIYFKDWIE